MKKLSFISVLCFLTTSCGGGGGTPYSAPTNPNNGSSSTPGGPSSTTPPTNSATTWGNFNFTASVSGGANSSFQTVSINTTNKTITVSLPLPFDSTLDGILVNTPLPQVKGATLAFTQLADGTPVLTVTLPLSAIATGVTGLPTSTLPDGSPIPGMPASSEPEVQVQVGSGKIPVYVYIGQMSVGLFVNTPFDPMIATQFQINDGSGDSVGAIYSIPYVSPNKNGGFFLNVNVPSQYTQLILSNI